MPPYSKMRSRTILTTLALSAAAIAADAVHGQGELGNTMGSVGFLWPSSREWSADADKTAPCGSHEGPKERTKFPISQGSVSLSIADEAYDVAFYIAVDDDPDSASDFQAQVVQNVAQVEPGHQCYKLRNIPNVSAGTDATIQLRYWANYEDDDDEDREKFYACADITFVDAADFDIQTPCFNVTSEEFGLPTPSSAPNPDADNDNVDADAHESSSASGGGLSKGATAGVAVGTIVGSLSVVGLIAWFVFLRRKHRQVGHEERTPKEVEEVSY
ncbi:hypothetical protein VUR80DRAFT_3712 [Thermomyces stellatus]